MITQTSYLRTDGILRYGQSSKSLKKKFAQCRCCPITTEQQNLTIHHVLPQFLGKFLIHDEFLQSWTVALCRHCHNLYEKQATIAKKAYFKEHSLTFTPTTAIVDPLQILVKKAATSLRYNIDDMTDSKVHERVNLIKSYLCRDYYTTQDLMTLSTMAIEKVTITSINPGDYITNQFNIETLRHFWYNHYLQWENKRVEKRVRNLHAIAA